MAERRASWPWRKRTTPRGDKVVEGASPPSSFKYESLPSNAQNGRQELAVPILSDDPRLLEVTMLREQAEATVRELEEKLCNALENAASNESLAKQHEKAMEEALSGWKKSECESSSYKQELEVATKQKLILEDRVSHLDGALKECMKQVRQVKEEQEKKIEDTIMAKTREWENVKADIDARQMELERRLMESEAQNSAMTKSMQERAKKILESNDAREKAETQGKVLQVKVASLEKEISALKYELHVLNKELEIRNEEVEGNKKAADAAHKNHLENVKKVAKLEADCQRLRNLLRKKLPGPAAIAQMRREVDISRENLTVATKKTQSKSPLYSARPFLSSYGPSEISLDTKEVESLKDRMSSMEEETKLLREALSKRNEELNASRILCATTANNLSLEEDRTKSLQGTSKEAGRNVSDVNATAEPSVGSVSKDSMISGNVEEASCAESWASALISELALFKKGNYVSEPSKESTESSIAIKTSASNDESPAAQVLCNRTENSASEPTVEGSVVYVRFRELGVLCKELDCKFSTIQEQLKLQKSESVVNSQEPMKHILCFFETCHEKFAHMKNIINLMEDAGQTWGTVQPSSPAARANSEESSCLNPIPISSLRTVLSKLISVLETLIPRCMQRVDITSSSVVNSRPEQKDCVSEQETVVTAWDRQKEALLASKESFLEGKSTVSEFLVWYGIILCEACELEHRELEELLGSLRSAGNSQVADVSSSGFLSELAVVCDRLQQTRNAKDELVVQLAAVTEELEGTKLELGASKELVINLQHEVAGLHAVEQNLAAVEEMRVELQQKLEKAEGDTAKLQVRVESLTLELDKEKKAREAIGAKCEELERQLEGHSTYEDECNGFKVSDDEDTRLSKESELVAAKEKLAECQRTILALGKQLSALSSPPTEISPGGSFDAVSMDSMLEQRMHMELLQAGAAAAGALDQRPNTHPNYSHSYHGGYNGDLTPPGAMPGQYSKSHSSRRAMHATPPQQQQQQQQAGWRSSAGGGGRVRARSYTDNMQPDAPRSWGGRTNGSLNGPSLPATESPHHHQTYYHHQQPPRSQGRSAYVSPSCRQYSLPDVEASAWAPVYIPEEDERPNGAFCSSPARSPGRLARQLRGGQQPSGGRPAICTSLADSMDAAATSTSASNGTADLKALPAKSSGIGKLFSRPKNHR